MCVISDDGYSSRSGLEQFGRANEVSWFNVASGQSTNQ